MASKNRLAGMPASHPQIAKEMASKMDAGDFKRMDATGKTRKKRAKRKK